MGSMQALSVVLLLISIGTIVGPVAGVVVMYRDNLSQLVIPPQINHLLNNAAQSNNNNNLNNSLGSGNFGVGDSNNNDNSGGGGLINPVFVGAQINNAARTFTVTVNVTNNFGYDLTLNSLNATVESSQNNDQLATITLASPVTLLSGQTSQVTV